VELVGRKRGYPCRASSFSIVYALAQEHGKLLPGGWFHRQRGHIVDSTSLDGEKSYPHGLHSLFIHKPLVNILPRLTLAAVDNSPNKVIHET
jgi:hypothetical protein